MRHAQAIERNELEQIFTLKAFYLPHAPDNTESYARALWLDKSQTEKHAIAVANGIAKAFNGE
ncbi:DUF6890 family protein [Moritella viscosa]|uniref:DUF6890 family protein n=1 Tax=Moritella viscosa TaxID=80854 RepID=UPI003BB649F1